MLIRLLRALSNTFLYLRRNCKIVKSKDVSQVGFGSAGKESLSVQDKEAIEAEKLPGIKFSRRVQLVTIQMESFASHLIGYTDTVQRNCR